MIDPDLGETGAIDDAQFDDARLAFRVAEAVAVVSDLSPGLRLDLPATDERVMHVVLAGSVRFDCDGAHETASEGDVVYANYGHAHAICLDDVAPPQARLFVWPRFTAWDLHPPAPDACAAAAILSFRLQISYLPPSVRSIRVFPPIWVNRRTEADANLRPLGLDLPQIRALCAGPGASSFLTNLASLLFVHGMRGMYRKLWREEPVGVPAEGQRRIAAALLAMERYPERPWTLDGLAQAVGCARSTFAVLFREATGETPYQFLKQRRMEAAHKLLNTTRFPIEEIARRCGYPVPASFSRQFRQTYGVAPGSIRRPR